MTKRGRAEGVLAHAIGLQAAEVDVGKRELRLRRETLRFGEQRAIFVDEGVAVPREIGGRFALSRGAVEIGGDTARRLVADQLVAVALLAHDDIRRREIGHYRGPGKGAIR